MNWKSPPGGVPEATRPLRWHSIYQPECQFDQSYNDDCAEDNELSENKLWSVDRANFDYWAPRAYRNVNDVLSADCALARWRDGYSPTWEGRCINQKSPLHRSLPRRRRCSTSMTARGGPFPTMSTPLSQVSLKPAGMIRLCLSARWWNSAMPCPRRTAVLWPPALHSAVHLPREALRSCSCSIPIGLSAARLPKRLLRSPPRYRRRRFGAWSQCAIGGPRMSGPKSTASFARRARRGSIARNGKRVVPKRFSLLPSMVPQLKDSCWCHRRAEKNGSRRS